MENKENNIRNRKRAANYSQRELESIMFAVEENFEIINSKLTDEITNQKKRAAWSKVAQKVGRFFLYRPIWHGFLIVFSLFSVK